jgi:hypothetical protein
MKQKVKYDPNSYIYKKVYKKFFLIKDLNFIHQYTLSRNLKYT